MWSSGETYQEVSSTTCGTNMPLADHCITEPAAKHMLPGYTGLQQYSETHATQFSMKI